MSRSARCALRARPVLAMICGAALLGGLFTGVVAAPGTGASAAAASVSAEPVAGRGGIVSAPAFAHGTGEAGRLMVAVTPTMTGTVDLVLSGLAAGVTQSAPDATGYSVSVAPGARWARFDLSAGPDGAPIDAVVILETNQGAALRWTSEVAAAAGPGSRAGGRVDIADPAPGSYRVAPATPTGGAVLTSYVALPGVTAGAFSVHPAGLAAQSQVSTAYAVTWSGLAEATGYLGVIDYRAGAPAPGAGAADGDAAGSGADRVVTVVSVDSGLGRGAPGSADDGTAAGAPPGVVPPEAPAVSEQAPAGTGSAGPNPVNSGPPVIIGTPEVGRVLHAYAGQWAPDDLDVAFRWQADGVNINGAAGPRFRVKPAQAGAVLTVVVTVTGRNHSPALARSSGVRVKSLAEVIVSTNHRRVAPGATVTLTVTVRSSDSVTGAVTVRVNAKRHTVRLGDDGVGTLRLVSKTSGWYRVTASYPGSDTVSAALSAPVSVRVTR